MEPNTQEKKNRRRGLMLAVALHCGVLVGAFLPFLSRQATPPEYEQVIEISFATFQHSSRQSDERAGAARPVRREKAIEPAKKVVEPLKPKPAPKPKPVVQTPE
ncbi:MAG: hypothetical protein D6765_02950, partial [Bacteroidetes bacterium]